MKVFPLGGASKKILIRFSCAFCLALLSVIHVSAAQVSDSVIEKVPKHVLKELTSGKFQDLIVIFNDNVAQKSTAKQQSMTGLPSHHSQIIEHKAAQYAETKQRVFSAFGSHEAEELKQYSHLPAGFIRIHSKTALDKLLANPDIVGVYENTAERKFLAESLPLIGQPQVAAQGTLGTGTAVAVLDTGVDYTKTAFGSCSSPGVPTNCKVVYAQDFAPGDSKLDDNGHGTNVAGIVLGVAPGTKILALDVFGSSGTASGTDIISAINWVIANKATYNIVAMNLSLGSGKYTSQTLESPYYTAFANARAAGILPIVAAGNEGYSDGLASPAAVKGAVSVGAVYDSTMGPFNWGVPLRCSDTSSAADKVTCFSNSASFLTMLAPGSQIFAAGITESGTSQATPHVAGAVAVLRAAFPNETLDQTVARLMNGVMVSDSKNDITKPRLSLPMALGLNSVCTYSISETGKSFSSISSSGTVAVTTGAGCSWSAASTSNDSSWITVTSGSSGSGNGTVSYAISVNNNSASRTGTITIAGQTYTVTQTGAVGVLSNILLNSGFESGPVSWGESTYNGYPIITSYLTPTSSNNWYAWLCGYNNCMDNLYQDVTVPADAQNSYLQFNYSITTDETSNATAFDSMAVRIYSPPAATTYKSLGTLSNLNATSGWDLSPKYDLSAFKGQTIRVQFSATTDASFTTSFFVDDVVLMVTGSTPDTQAPTVPTGLTATGISASVVNLAWHASTDNAGVTSYKVYRNGALLAALGNVTSYSNVGLSAGTSYSYAVSACDTAGNCSAQSVGATVVTPVLSADSQPPSVPTGLAATTVSTSAINLSWLASTDNVGVSKYNIYRNGTLLTDVPGNKQSYSNINLTPSTPFSYTVSACDTSGNCSAQSSAVQATTYAPFTGASLLTLSGPSSYQVNGNLVNINVDKITNSSNGHSGSLRIELWALAAPYFGGSVSGYRTASVRTNLINGAADYLPANSNWSNITLNRPYTAPPPNNPSYALFLLEYDSVNCSMADNFCIAAYLNYHELQAPTVPTGLTYTAISSSQISLTWGASSDNVGVTTYKVFRNGILVSLLGNVTSYIDGGLAASTLYSYTVSACDVWDNCSAQSSATSVRTSAPPDTQAPTVPTGLKATAVSSTSINLSWTAAADNVGVTAYKVFSDNNLVATLGNVTSTSRTNTPSTTYSYTVSACDAAGNCSAQSNVASATTPAPPDTQPPTVPTGLTATAVSSSQINLFWAAATDNVGVTAYRVSSSDGQVATLGNVTNYSHINLRISTAYSYTVAACDASGNCSAPSSLVSATTVGNSINGSCGSANGTTVTTVPTINLCTTGTATAITGTGPWGWTCTGINGGTTATCNANITIAPITQFTVTPQTGSSFTISPATSQTVNRNATTSFNISPAAGFGITTVSGCGGSLSGNTFTTGAITANCTVNVMTVTRNASSGTAGPTLGDALKVLQMVAGISQLTPVEMIRYDVAPLGSSGSPLGNGVIDAADVILILRRSIGIGSW